MKNICRDFTIVIGVPDDVKPEDCEIVIDKATAEHKQGDKYIEIAEDKIDIIPEEPYDCTD